MTRRIIDELELSHIAAVDNPCQEFATARIIKRRPDETERVPISKAAPKSGGEDEQDGDLDEEIAAIMTAEKCSKAAAMVRLAKSKPQLVAAAQSAPVEKARASFQLDESFGPVRKAAQATFVEKARELAVRDRIPLHAAMDRARRAFPDAYREAFAA